MKPGLDREDMRYEYCDNYEKLQKCIEGYMMDETKLDLILFKDCVEHVCRVSRVLMMQRGHFMLVGLGGSGKTSIATLSSALQVCKLETITAKKNYGPKEFKEDLLRMMKRAAI